MLNRPKQRQWQPTKKHGFRAKDFWQPLGGFDFPLGYPWRVHRTQHTSEENGADPKLAPIALAPRCEAANWIAIGSCSIFNDWRSGHELGSSGHPKTMGSL